MIGAESRCSCSAPPSESVSDGKTYPLTPPAPTNAFTRLRQEATLAVLAPTEEPAPQLVLDIGCGDGTVARELGMLIPNAIIVGLDQTDYVAWRRNSQSISFARGDAESIPVKSGI